MDLLFAAGLLPGLVIGLTLHECAHAWSASLLGDDLARRQKRISLNPLRQMSGLGTLALFVLRFGWGKPVPVNLYNFKRPRRDYLLTSLAGPAMNVLIAAVGIALMYLTRRSYAFGPLGVPLLGMAHALLWLIVLINVILAAVNLVPIPPLDGSKIWACLIPGLKMDLGKKTTFAFIAVLLVLLYSGHLGDVISAVIDPVMSLAPETDESRVEHLVEWGSAAAEAERHDEAVRYFSAALAIHPDNFRALCGRAPCLVVLKRPDEALPDADRAIALWRSNADLYDLRAEIRRAMDQQEEMTADYERADLLRGFMPAYLMLEQARRDNRVVLERLKGNVTKMDFDGIGLGDVLQFFRDATAQPVRVDWDALEQSGLTPKTPVQCQVENETFRKVLRQILKQANPDEPVYYGVAGGEIVIPAGAEGGIRLKNSSSQSDPLDED